MRDDARPWISRRRSGGDPPGADGVRARDDRDCGGHHHGTLPRKIGAELEAFDISGIEVMEPLCDDYFVEMLVAEGGRKGE